MKVAFVLALLVVPAAAWAQAPLKSIDDCERFSEPLAYNACLAKFGPERRAAVKTTTEVSDEPDGDKAAEAAPKDKKQYTSRRGRHREYSRNRRGRASASFDVSGYFNGGSHKYHSRHSYHRRRH